MVSETTRKKYASTWGLALGPQNPLDNLVFDRHTQTPQDPAHLLLQNLTKYVISTTLDLLNSTGKKEFVDTLASMELPQGWSRFQNPVSHLKSFFFSDYAKLMMIGPFLVMKLRDSHFSTGVLEKMRHSMNLAHCSQVLNEILLCWTTMATTNAMCFASVIRDYDLIDRNLHDLAAQLIKGCI
jgi:hypothetical protein